MSILENHPTVFDSIFYILNCRIDEIENELCEIENKRIFKYDRYLKVISAINSRYPNAARNVPMEDELASDIIKLSSEDSTYLRYLDEIKAVSFLILEITFVLKNQSEHDKKIAERLAYQWQDLKLLDEDIDSDRILKDFYSIRGCEQSWVKFKDLLDDFFPKRRDLEERVLYISHYLALLAFEHGIESSKWCSDKNKLLIRPEIKNEEKTCEN